MRGLYTKDLERPETWSVREHVVWTFHGPLTVFRVYWDDLERNGTLHGSFATLEEAMKAGEDWWNLASLREIWQFKS